mmetsp:Transcript_13298/g.44049  ORF Transcript_13298/g.44049 Transcript_13298/m.44049 type:complete len:222 (+) Transcript_13298:2059-2724(+)
MARRRTQGTIAASASFAVCRISPFALPATSATGAAYAWCNPCATMPCCSLAIIVSGASSATSDTATNNCGVTDGWWSLATTSVALAAATLRCVRSAPTPHRVGSVSASTLPITSSTRCTYSAASVFPAAPVQHPFASALSPRACISAAALTDDPARDACLGNGRASRRSTMYDSISRKCSKYSPDASWPTTWIVASAAGKLLSSRSSSRASSTTRSYTSLR